MKYNLNLFKSNRGNDWVLWDVQQIDSSKNSCPSVVKCEEHYFLVNAGSLKESEHSYGFAFDLDYYEVDVLSL